MDKAKQTTHQFTAEFTDIQAVNPLFSKCKVKVMYTGDNRNNSSFTKNVVENAIPSIFNIPIIGEFIENVEDFGGHGGKIEITDKEIKMVQTTKPYGVVPESADVYWETVTENGEEHDYLVVDGCYLWTGRYDEAQSVIENGKGQSMEIEINSGDFNENSVFEVKDFTFSALCILGDEVEPCFEGADITTSFNLNKEDFKQQFNQMLKELKFSLDKKSDEGGVKMGDMFKKVYELSHSDIRTKLYQQLDATLSDNQYSWIVDVYDSYFIAEIETYGDTYEYRFYKFDYSKLENDEISVDLESKAEVEEDRKWVEVSAYELLKEDLTNQFEKEKSEAIDLEVGKVKADFADLEKEHEDLKQEVESLRTFKHNKEDEERKEQEKELFANFSKVLNEDDISELKENASDYSLEELENQLYILVGRKKSNFSVSTRKKSDMVKVQIDDDIEGQDEKPYGDLFTTYKK